MRPLACAAVVVCGGLFAAEADARTWSVGRESADFPLVAPAIAAASSGDTILVRPGVYREDLVIDRSIALIGEGWPVLIGTGAGTVIEIRASGVELRGLVIEGSGTGLTNLMDAAVHVMDKGNRVAGNIMRRVFYGVVIVGAGDNEVAGNTIEGLSDRPFGQRGDGVYLYRAPDSRVMRNRISGMRDGIYFQYAPRGVAAGNMVARSRYGLHDMFSDEARIEGNVFRDSLVGATIMNSARVVVRGNRVERNRGEAAVGLSIKQCDDSLVESNLVVSNTRGTLIDGSSRNRFVKNRFAFNDTAVTLFASSEGNTFTLNVFDENWSDVVVSGRGAGTEWSAGGKGNWWGGYRGFDFDGDGVGESPHPIVGAFEQLEGRQPVTRLFLQSPAARALALAAGLAAPDSRETDRAPLTRLVPDAAGGARPTPFPDVEPTDQLKGRMPAAAVLLFLCGLFLCGSTREVRPCSM